MKKTMMMIAVLLWIGCKKEEVATPAKTISTTTTAKTLDGLYVPIIPYPIGSQGASHDYCAITAHGSKFFNSWWINTKNGTILTADTIAISISSLDSSFSIQPNNYFTSICGCPSYALVCRFKGDTILMNWTYDMGNGTGGSSLYKYIKQ